LYLISNRPNETKVLSTQRDADTTSDTAAAVDSTAALVDSATEEASVSKERSHYLAIIWDGNICEGRNAARNLVS